MLIARTNNVIDVDAETPVALGRGYNTFRGQFRGNGISVPADVEEVTSQDIAYRLQKISSHKQLRESLNVIASASFGLFGSGTASYARQSEYNTYSLFVL